MKEHSQKLQDWVIHKIKTEYADDVDLLIAVTGQSVNGDDHGEEFDYFIPATEKGCQLAETFIIDGIGHDLYPRSWERMQRTADLEEGQEFTIGHSKVLYARNKMVLKRYEELCSRMQNNLNDPQYTFSKALEQLDIAMDVYRTLMFEDKLCQVRLGVGLIMHYLNRAVFYLNGTYLPQKDILEKLQTLSLLPRDFLIYEEAILQAKYPDELKNTVSLLLKTTRVFLSTFQKEDNHGEVPDFQGLADWYQELSLAWQRLFYYSQAKDYRNAFTDALYLQSELNVVSAEFSLKELDLLSAYDPTDLSVLADRAKNLELYILQLLAEQKIQLNQYADIQEFLEAH